jgi:hypothetical protein
MRYAKLTRRLDDIEPRANRTCNFLWDRKRDDE